MVWKIFPLTSIDWRGLLRGKGRDKSVENQFDVIKERRASH
jgi:hypothetical protein